MKILPALYGKRLELLVLGVALLITAGCATKPAQVQSYQIGSVSGQDYAKLVANQRMPTRKGFWDSEAYAAATGQKRIVVNLKAQRAFFYKGQELVGMSPVATGKAGHRTPDGSYTLIGKDRDHESNLYGTFVNAAGDVVQSDVDARTDTPPPGATFAGAPMPYFLRLKHHASGVTSIGLHGGRVPRGPASHGCIRLPNAMARQFYDHAETGMPVTIECASPQVAMLSQETLPYDFSAMEGVATLDEKTNTFSLPEPDLPGDGVY